MRKSIFVFFSTLLFMTSLASAKVVVFWQDGFPTVASQPLSRDTLVTVFNGMDPVFAGIDALRDPAADTDKNESITAAEAFRYAAAKTKNFYDTQKRLATEHAELADGAQGLAGRFVLARFGGAGAAFNDPAKRALLDRKEVLEQQIDKLKYEKAAMPLEEYKKRLTALLLDLARVQEEMEK